MLTTAAVAAERNVPRQLSDGSYLLPNGWALSPAGRQVELGGLPLKLIAVPQTRYALAASNGYKDHFLAVIDMEAEQVVQRLPIQEGWMGIASSPAGDVVYASAGGQDRILVFRFSERTLSLSHEIPLSVRAFPAGLALSRNGDRLLGTRPGIQTPRAMMAENDFVLGKMIEALSGSRFWKEMAIFVVEDETQGGPDHVDAHRAPVLMVSPYSRINSVDSTMYSSSSVLRTMELILGLRPLTQYDAAATPMWAAFHNTPDYRPYTAVPPSIDLNEQNPTNAYGAKRSVELTLESADTSDDREYNEIIWKAVRGADSPLPPKRVATFVVPR